MNYNWKNDGDLSAKSDRDYLSVLIQSLTHDLHTDSSSREILFKRGNAYLDSGLYEHAIKDYTELMEKNEEDCRVWNNRGICYRALMAPEAAISDFDKAISLNKLYRDAYNNRGMALSDLEKYGDAIKDFSKSIEIA